MDKIVRRLIELEVPPCLRICVGTDGSVTTLIEVMTGEEAIVETIEQRVVEADEPTAKLLGIEVGDRVNHREVLIKAGGVVYEHALSLSPLQRMPTGMQDDLMRADTPIGNILRDYGLETRRDLLGITMVGDTGPYQGYLGEARMLSRQYNIVYQHETLMWIQETFPIDQRWKPQ